MKFTDEDLQKLLDQNRSKTEIAQKLGVTKETVRYRTKQLKSKQKSIVPEILDLEAQTDKIDCKSALTLQEQIFLDLHLIEKKPIKDAMNQAGYNDLPERTLYFRAKKIVQKFEAKAGDHRNIFRAIGLGEVRVAMGVLELCNSKNEKNKALGLQLASKCLGLQREVMEGGQGVTIIIQGPGSQIQPSAPDLPAPPALPGAYRDQPYQHPQPTAPGKPITITK